MVAKEFNQNGQNDQNKPLPSDLSAGDNKFFLQGAATLVSAALEEKNTPRRQSLIAKALEIYKPLVEQNIAEAALSVGMLCHALAYQALNDPELQQEERLAYASKHFANAVKYFEKAIVMPVVEGDHSVAQAEDNLAQYHEQGLMKDGAIDLEKAFSLRQSAATKNFAEAQINLALMYYNGQGTQQLLPDAQYWMSRAWKNREQLTSSVRSNLKGMLQDLGVNDPQALIQSTQKSPDENLARITVPKHIQLKR